MSEIKTYLSVLVLLAIFTQENNYLKIGCVIFIILSFVYSQFFKGKRTGNSNNTNTTIIFNQNNDKLSIDKDGKVITENKSVESTNKMRILNILIILSKKTYTFSVAILAITYIKFMIISFLISIWIYFGLYFFDLTKYIRLEIIFIPFLLLFFNSIRTIYLFRNLYSGGFNKDNDYLKTSYNEILFNGIIFVLYFFLHYLEKNSELLFIVYFTHLILPFGVILFLQIFVLIEFRKKQYLSINNSYNYIRASD